MEFNSYKEVRNGTTNDQSPFVQNVLSKSVLLFLVTVLVILIVQVARVKKITKLLDLVNITISKRNTGIPTVSMLSILKYLYLYGTDFGTIAEMMTAEYGGIVQISFLGLYNFVFITNSSMLQKIYMSNNQGYLHKPQLYNTVFFGPIKDGLTVLPPVAWKIHRSAISKVFTYNGLLRQLNIFEEHAKRFVLTLQESPILAAGSNKQVISFDKHVNTLIFEIILHIAAGKEIDVISQEEIRGFKKCFEELEELVLHRFRNPLNLLDPVWKLNPLKMELDRQTDKLTKFINKVLAGIRKQFDDKTIDSLEIDDDMDGKSLIEVMLKAGFSDKEILADMAILLGAGLDTTSTTLKLLLFLLSKKTEYLNKCREEIDQMFTQMSASNTHEISMEALNSLNFVDMCIKECLRMYPVIPLFGRELKSPIQLDENTYLPHDTVVITSPWIMHRNSKVYPEPEKFDPDRFLPENIKNRGMCDYMPFSVGPRNCIGFKAAVIELKVLVAFVLRNFEVSSEVSFEDLDEEMKKKWFPFPDLDIKIHPRQ